MEAILQQAIDLSIRFYGMHGYVAQPNERLWRSTHPQEQLMFRMASHAVDVLTDSEVWDYVYELDEEEENLEGYVFSTLPPEV